MSFVVWASEAQPHVAQSRLKLVLDEVASYQAAQTNGLYNGPESEAEETSGIPTQPVCTI